MTLSQSRKVLDALISKFEAKDDPHVLFTKINSESTLVTHSIWEKTIVKLQGNREDLFTSPEKR
jgi:hypothetical protein